MFFTHLRYCQKLPNRYKVCVHNDSDWWNKDILWWNKDILWWDKDISWWKHFFVNFL